MKSNHAIESDGGRPVSVFAIEGRSRETPNVSQRGLAETSLALNAFKNARSGLATSDKLSRTVGPWGGLYLELFVGAEFHVCQHSELLILAVARVMPGYRCLQSDSHS
jgi:hypothetical protein